MGKCSPVTRIIPASCAWIVLLLATGIFFAFPCRYLMSFYSIAIPVFQSIVAFFVIINFALATFVNPGVIPKAKPDELKGDGITSPTYQDIEIHGVRVRLKWCVTCQFYRPPRCVHCGICDTCIETFDHHCPWVNNCIGRRNYRYFFMFLLWLSIHMCSILALCALYMKDHLDNMKQLETIMTLIIIGIIIVLFIPILGLTAYHIMLIMQGKTTNEQVTGKFLDVRNPYTRGCCKNILYSLCNSPLPKFKSESSFYASINKHSGQNISGHQLLKENQTHISEKAPVVQFKFTDQTDFMVSKKNATSECEKSSPSYLDRGHLHLSLDESVYVKKPDSALKNRGSRALTPPVPIRFDCSRRSLPPHNRMHAPSPHYVVAQSVHGNVFHTQKDFSKVSACTSGHSSNSTSYFSHSQNPALVKYDYGASSDACGTNFYFHLYKRKDSLPKMEGFAFTSPDSAAAAGKELMSDTCCLGNQTVDKLHELANRTMIGGQCTDVSVLEAFPKGCSSFHNSPNKEHHDVHKLLIAQTPQQLFANNCVDCQQNSSTHSCQSSTSGEFVRTPGNRPLSFVKAMEMSETLDWNSDDHHQHATPRDTSIHDIASDYKLQSLNINVGHEQNMQQSDNEISYEISV